MRRWWIFAVVLGWWTLAIGAPAAEYERDAPISLQVRVSASTVAIGQMVTINVEASDTDLLLDGRRRERVDDPVTLTFEVTGGDLQRRSPTNNPALLIWQAPTRPGRYALFITATDSGRFFRDEPVRRIVEFTVTQPGVVLRPGLNVSATPRTIRLDREQTATIAAQLLDGGPAGREVRFFSSGGRLSATRVAVDARGMASVRLTVNEVDVGTVTVAAAFGDSVVSTAVRVVEREQRAPVLPPPYLPNPPGLFVSVEPPTLPADGRSTAIVRVRLTDYRGLPLQRQQVVFRSTIGGIAPRMTLTDYWGHATAEFFAPDIPGSGFIVVNAGTLTGSAPVTIMPVDTLERPGRPRVFLTLNPTRQQADGASRVQVEALVLDGNSRAVRGARVDFSTTLGALQQTSAVTDAEGRAGTVLIAPDRPGLAVVTATADRIVAASQVQFEGAATAKPALEIRGWAGQRTAFVAPRWLWRELRLEAGGQGATAGELQILDEDGEVTEQIALGASGILVRDQDGLAHGYCLQEGDRARIVLLHPDGALARILDIPLAIGSHVRQVSYASPAGQVLALVSRPDGTRPELRFFAPDGAPLLALDQGLERLPDAALGGDGYLALALAGGTVRLYNPLGQPISEARRTDGLPVTRVAVGPAGAWVAVAAALPGQTERPPAVSIFSQRGAPVATFALDAAQLVPVASDALAISTAEQTVMINITGKSVAWRLDGNFERLLAVGNRAILAGHHSAQSQGIATRLTVVQVRDGRVLGSETFDVGSVMALTSSVREGLVTLLGQFYAIDFALP